MTKALCVLLVFCLGQSQALACFMLPEGYEGKIRQRDHEAVILHHGNREELVLRINYQIAGATMPGDFAWVITVPNEPDRYAVAKESLFKDMFDLARELKPKQKTKIDAAAGGFGGGGGAFGDKGVELGKHAVVGPYDIQPIRGVGPNALKGLNAWLEANGFPTEDPDHMEYFVKRDFTFLCIKIVAPEDEAAVRSSGFLPPLHLSLASPKPYYPLRFSSRQGAFDVNLHVLTPRKLDYAISRRVLRQIRWSRDLSLRNHKLAASKMPDSLRTVVAESKSQPDRKTWYYNNLRGVGVNANDAIARWTTDIFFNGVPSRSDYRRARQERVGLDTRGNVSR